VVYSGAPSSTRPWRLLYFGPVQAGLYGLILLAVGASIWRGESRSKRQLWLFGFYVFAGLATLAKGLLGIALPGAFIFFYLLMTGEWRRLREMELLRGVGLFLCVSFPWYVAMLVRHGNAYFQRFFIHDHFKRLATGVHQIDSGSFEHYVKWMGYGLWPWTGFLPAALVRLFSGDGLGDRSDRQKATLFLVIWLSFTFTLFTLSSTKFHHYIFPAVPAACFLIALTLDSLIARTVSKRLHMILYLAMVGMAGFLAWDLIDDPRHLKNLFTYKYDREWDNDWNPSFRAWMTGIAAVAMTGAVMMGAARLRLRRAGLALMGVGALAMAVFCLDIYMPTISSHLEPEGRLGRVLPPLHPRRGPPRARREEGLLRRAGAQLQAQLARRDLLYAERGPPHPRGP
jgi:4-amino-4-deoxy-L-arabinose transferase-like glycosyltransferase